MGTAGSGKSTTGSRLAVSLSVPFIEADDFHPDTNRAKMAAGIGLTNDDRRPWVAALGRARAELSGPLAVLACSALNPEVRQWMRDDLPGAVDFICLQVSRDELSRRLQNRRDHFVGVSLLDSQQRALTLDRYVHVVSGEGAIHEVVKRLKAKLHELSIVTS